MIRWLAVMTLGAAACARAGGPEASGAEAAMPCSDAWYRSVEAKLPTGDGQGHGPDVGSDEWKSVVEFKLGIRGKPGVPARDSAAWCTYIGRLVIEGGPPAANAAHAAGTATAHGPSFDCSRVATGSIEAMICADEDKRACVGDEYRRRTAERGDSVSLMYQQPSASGARYQGRNETFWEHQGVAAITWGYGAPEMHCKNAGPCGRRVTPAAQRRRGAGRAILAHIIEVAKARSYERLSLETGAMEPFRPAQRLYQSFGFDYCGPFGDYVDDPNSVFMTLRL